MNILLLEDHTRFDILKILEGNNLQGVELGVAQGSFSIAMLNSGRFKSFSGVDSYDDGIHNTSEYIDTMKAIGFHPAYTLIRARFNDASALFEDNSLDFVYVDGYAHGGEDGGKTICDWYNKIKVGGAIAGDDYHSDWPLVVSAVNHVANQLNSDIYVTDSSRSQSADYSMYPSWAIKKIQDTTVLPNKKTVLKGQSLNAAFRIKNKIVSILKNN